MSSSARHPFQVRFARQQDTHDATLNIARKLGAVDSRVQTLQVTVDTGFAEVKAELGTVHSRLDTMNSEIGTVKAAVVTLDENFLHLNQKLDRILAHLQKGSGD